ncbi:hypothetical protein [Sporosarcina aquimarina]|uniref:Uncharacterized protein n=1 Tax=Sporosarcina aquimarina TaxID=114975 RepID=A0ABU4FY85_9BACL|nr:hypothetical protein [Sporosarcina aquimarina]MDW0109686.1 hypothetical protein [Sporosarcina aquimarina]
MERRAATPEGSAKFEDPAESKAIEEAESEPLGKRPLAAEINSVSSGLSF